MRSREKVGAPALHVHGLSRSQGVALYLAAFLGAGLLALPSLAYQASGASSLVAWAALIALSVPVAITFAHLGAEFPDAGGVATYAERAFGPSAGVAVGLWFVLALPFGAPSAAIVGGQYVAQAVGSGPTLAYAAAVLLLLAATAIALAGLQVAASLQLVLAATLAVVLCAAAFGAIPSMDAVNMEPWMPHGLWGLGSAIGVLFFSFSGWEAVSPLVREFRNPRRDALVVAWCTLAVIAFLNMVLAVASVLAFGPRLNASSAPVSDLLALWWPDGAGVVTAILAVFLTLGAMSGFIRGAAFMLSALARDGWLPAFFAQGHRTGEVPRRAICVIALAAMGVLLTSAAFGVGLATLMPTASVMFAAVTAAGMAAGVRSLPGRRKLLALAGLIPTLGVVIGCGWALLYPLGAAGLVGVLTFTRRSR